MRIAFAVSSLAVGGAERNAVNYAIAFRRRGHDVFVIAGDGPLRSDLDDAGVPWIRATAHLSRPWQLVAFGRTLAARARETHVDVVQCFMASSTVGAKVAKLLGADFLLVTAPPGVTEDPREPHWVTSLRLRLLLGSTDVALSTSPPFREVMERAGMRRTRIVDVDFNAIPIWRYEASPEAARAVRDSVGIAQDAFVVCALARLHPLKRLDLVLRAAASVVARLPQTCFLLVGDGPERARLEALARELGISGAVRFARVRRDVGAVLRASDVLLQTTFGFGGPGLSTLEAFAASRPVIAFDAADRRDAIGDSGATVFVADGDTDALARAIVDLLQDPERRSAMGASGRRWVGRRFNLDTVAAELERIYRGAA